MSDIERVIMPGVTHWHSPRFHAYFPTANSYPAIVAVIFAFFCFYSDCSVNRVQIVLSISAINAIIIKIHIKCISLFVGYVERCNCLYWIYMGMFCNFSLKPIITVIVVLTC